MQTSKLWDSFCPELLVYAMSEYQDRIEEANCASFGYFVHRFCQSSDISGKNRTRIFNDTFAIYQGATRVMKSNLNVSKLCPILWCDVGPFTEYRFGTLSKMIFRGRKVWGIMTTPCHWNVFSTLLAVCRGKPQWHLSRKDHWYVSVITLPNYHKGSNHDNVMI